MSTRMSRPGLVGCILAIALIAAPIAVFGIGLASAAAPPPQRLTASSQSTQSMP